MYFLKNQLKLSQLRSLKTNKLHTLKNLLNLLKDYKNIVIS